MLKQSLIKKLLERRIPQILGSYLIAGTSLILFIDYLVGKYQFPSHYPTLALFALIGILPSVVILSYFHGAPGKDEWTKVEKVGIPINVLFIAGILFFGDSLNIWEIQYKQNESIDIFISGVQSEKLDLNPSKEFLHFYIYETTNPVDPPKIEFNLINEDKLDKLYQDVIINCTTKFYNLYDLVTLKDMQDRLASKGEFMNFNEIPSVLRSLDEGSMFDGDVRDHYDPIGDLLTKEFEKKPIYMFKIYAYEFTPTIDGNNIAGFVDFHDKHDHFGSGGFNTNIKDFGEDISEVINGHISSIFYRKYPSYFNQ